MNPGPGASWFEDMQAWQAFQASNEALLSARWQIEQALPATIASTDGGLLAFCRLCRAERVFAMPSAAQGQMPNLREELVCSGCGLNARVRTALALLSSQDGLQESATSVYITEQSSLAYAWLLSNYPGTIGTEYFADDQSRKRLEDHLEHLIGRRISARYGDVTALDFEDRSFDAVVSFDVLEHVPDYPAALRELARVLRPAGTLVLTAPFLPGESATLIRARVKDDGGIEHLLEPEYHGDPLKPDGGVLCFYHFGWDLLDEVRAAGFARAAMVLPWNIAAGEIGGCWTLLARR